MLGLVVVVTILFYLGLVAIASESATIFLVVFGLTVAAYVICRPSSSLIHRHKILITEDFVFNGTLLSRILDRRKFDLIKHASDETILTEVSSLIPPPELLILPIDFSSPMMFAELRELRHSERVRQIPILGIVTEKCHIDLNIRDLRLHGVVGLISEAAGREAVARFVDWVVGSTQSKRFSERVDCIIPVSVTSGRTRTSEYALNLSTSGIRITSAKRPKLNSDLDLSFRLPMISGESVSARGHVVYQRPIRNSAGRYEVGVHFRAIDFRSQNTINCEVSRILSA